MTVKTANFRGDIYKNDKNNPYNFYSSNVFCLARFIGICSEEDDNTDGDESTHSPPVGHRPRGRILTMRRKKKNPGHCCVESCVCSQVVGANKTQGPVAPEKDKIRTRGKIAQ